MGCMQSKNKVSTYAAPTSDAIELQDAAGNTASALPTKVIKVTPADAPPTTGNAVDKTAEGYTTPNNSEGDSEGSFGASDGIHAFLKR